MVGAERENFEDLEPLDCRKQRFQGLNITLFGTLVEVYCLIPQIFAQLMLKICPTFLLVNTTLHAYLFVLLVLFDLRNLFYILLLCLVFKCFSSGLDS